MRRSRSRMGMRATRPMAKRRRAGDRISMDSAGKTARTASPDGIAEDAAMTEWAWLARHVARRSPVGRAAVVTVSPAGVVSFCRAPATANRTRRPCSTRRPTSGAPSSMLVGCHNPRTLLLRWVF